MRHYERSEAIQKRATELGCFVASLLAMTATYKLISAAVPAGLLVHGQPAHEPSWWEIILDHLLRPLEYLELMALAGLRPERDHGFERRAARLVAGDLDRHHRGFLGKLEACARPFPH